MHAKNNRHGEGKQCIKYGTVPDHMTVDIR